MLIEFKVANFRSIREEQKLSLVANNADKELPGCVIERQLPGLSGLRYLKGAAIYGANASGKSNLVSALRFLSRLVLGSATSTEPGDPTGTEPFKLDHDSASRPSKFEISFVADETRYIFGVALTPERIVEEYLVAYPKGVPQRWYHRAFNAEKKLYEWGRPSTAFKQDRSLERKTKENSLFLSVGPQWNHEQLTGVFNWFKKGLRFIMLGTDDVLTPVYTARLFQKPSYHDRILNLLRSADFGITDAIIEMKVMPPEKLRDKMTPAAFSRLLAMVSSKEGKALFMKISLAHKARGHDPVPLLLPDEESSGTLRFFSLIGPWLETMDDGSTLFVDEIESSVHPLLVMELLKQLFSGRENPRGAQVVFTTHNPVLLDTTVIRRDQVWFTEKTADGATYLYPLTDYAPRKDEALAKGYLSGRYGAVPFIPEGLKT